MRGYMYWIVGVTGTRRVGECIAGVEGVGEGLGSVRLRGSDGT